MDNDQKKTESAKDEQKPYTFSDEATKNKIKKHINDIKDVITEEDIANAKIPGEEEEIPPVPTEEDNDEKGKKKEVPKSEGKPVTPWDIIN